VEVGQQRAHLLIGETPGESGHHSLARHDDSAHLGVICGSAAGERGRTEDAMEVWRNPFQRKIVVFVTMRAANCVDVLAFQLLCCKSWSGKAADRAMHPGCERGHRQNERARLPDFSDQLGLDLARELLADVVPV
jgi:hypothetical protein